MIDTVSCTSCNLIRIFPNPTTLPYRKARMTLRREGWSIRRGGTVRVCPACRFREVVRQWPVTVTTIVKGRRWTTTH